MPHAHMTNTVWVLFDVFCIMTENRNTVIFPYWNCIDSVKSFENLRLQTNEIDALSDVFAISKV